MTRGATISQDLRYTIIRMHSFGLKTNKISRYTSVPPRSVQNIIRHFNIHGELGGDKKKTGRRCKLTKDDIEVCWNLDSLHPANVFSIWCLP
jgi:hypothetical protein